jgi:2-polyprenyl-3-methyl-5-hydroxy-6-metoxy-1,4-benzoquinol methylase
VQCPVCRGGPLRPFDLDRYRDNRLDCCAGCGVWLVNPQYSDRWLREFYSGYISLTDRPAADLPRRSQPDIRAAGKRRALQLLGRHQRPGRILMVGCGDGLELQIARELGWQPEGYDVDPATTQALASRLQLPVHCGALADLLASGRSYDALFLDQVIEHPKNPGDYLQAAHALLRPGGLLFLATPNADSLSNRAKTLLGRLGLRGRRRGRHYHSGHHLFGFSPRVLRALLPALGFEVLTVRASLKPQRNPLTALLGRWLPLLDSNFALVARRR